MTVRYSLFWDITRRRVVIFTDVSGQRIGPELSVNNYHTTLPDILEERRSGQRRGGSLKSRLYVRSHVSVLNSLAKFA
jgi:hypothetical protein